MPNTEIKYQEDNFEPAIDQLNNKIVEILNKKKNNENIDQDLADLPASITEIKTGIPEEHSWKPLYINILQTYSDLQVILKEQVSLSSELDRSSGAGEELSRLRADKIRLEEQVAELQNQGSGPSEFEQKYRDAQKVNDSIKLIILDKEDEIAVKDAELNRLKK